MLEFKRGIPTRVLVRLLDDTGAPVAGVLYGDVTVTVLKADGTTAAVTPTALNWTEITTGAYVGLGVYNLVIPGSAVDVNGQFSYAVVAPGAEAFVGVVKIVAYEEADTKATAEVIRIAVQALPANPVLASDTRLDAIATRASQASVDALVAPDNAGINAGINAIKAKTDALDNAGIAAIKAKTDALDNPAIAAIKAKTMNLPTDPASATQVLTRASQVSVDAIPTHTLSSISGAVLDQVLGTTPIPGSLREAILLIRGLSQYNYKMDQTVYNDQGLLVSGRIRIYPTAADLDAGTNVLATFMTSSVADLDNGILPTQYQVRRV